MTMVGGAITAAEAAKTLLKWERMKESLVGYAESIVIPGAPISDDEDEAIFQPVGSGIALHHRVMMEKIEKCMTTPYGRLMVFAPPGSAKSTFVTVVGGTWFLGNNPGAELILTSHGTELAKKHGRKARSIVRQPIYRGCFETELSKETGAAELWSLTNGSEYKSGGILSGITGNRASGIIIDDPVRGREEARSSGVKRKIREAFDDDLMTRLKPGAWMIIVQTRWEVDDLAGGLLPEDYAGQSGPVLCQDGQVWEILNIPAECEFEDDPLGRPIGDGNGGVPGSMLWPDYFPPQHWAQHRKNERKWAALYQQRPRIEADREFSREWVKWYEPGDHPKYLMKYHAGDWAVTESQKADFTELGVAGVDDRGHLWLLDWWSGQVDPEEGIRNQLRLVDKWGVRVGYGEVGVIRNAIEPLLKRMKRERRGQKGCNHSPTLRMEYLPHIGDKVAKFQSFKGMAQGGMVHIPSCEWGERVVRMLEQFPDPRVHDDVPDTCGLFGRAVDAMTWARPEEPEHRKEGLKFGSWAWLTYNSKNENDDSKGPRLW